MRPQRRCTPFRMAPRWACALALVSPALALHVPLHVDLHADPARPGTLNKLLHELVPEWVERAGGIKCKQLSGGLTNIVIRARPAAGSACESLLLRVFGENSERVLDRDKELHARQTLSDHDRFASAAVVGTFTNGRVERYAPGRVLSLEEMREPRMAGKIARQLARLHGLDVPGEPRLPSLWGMLEKWLALVEEDGVALPAGVDAACVRGAIRDLRARVEATTSSPVVFAHNDASALNLIFDDTSDRLALIDFEYSMYNHRGFDLATHLSHWAGGALDGLYDDSRFPTAAEQHAFCSAYAEASGTDVDVDALLREVALATPLAHLVWGLWGVCSLPPNLAAPGEFSHLEYAERRLAAGLHPSHI